jgi:hypothetical protein
MRLLALLLLMLLWSPSARAQPVQYPALPQSCAGAIAYASATFKFSCIGTFTSACPTTWASNQTVANGTYPCFISPWSAATITAVRYYTGGSSTPSFTLGAYINGNPISGCTGITVSSASSGSTNCTGANTMSLNDQFTFQISGVSGTPNTADVQPDISRPPN